MKKIVITGATGLLGGRISKKLIERGDELTIFTRSPERAKKIIPDAKNYVKWDSSEDDRWIEHLDSKDAVIHLAGENIMGKRWDENHKKKLFDSRVIGTRKIVEGCGKVKNKPGVFICASAIGYYGSSYTDQFDENSEAGNDFIAGLVASWEKEASEVAKYGIRSVNIRTGIVLDTRGGAFAKMITPFKYCVGGPLGNGNQWFSWIHFDDLVGIYLFALEKNISGILNTCSPNPVRMKEFSKTMGRVMQRPSVFNIPYTVLKLLYAEGANEIIKSAKVMPRRTIEYGYKFKFEIAKEAIKDLLK